MIKFNILPLNILPRDFTITTNNHSCMFNSIVLRTVSRIVSNLIKDDSNTSEYHLDINDERNVLSKFERLYQGETIEFERDDLLILQMIRDQLNLFDFPDIKYELKFNIGEIQLYPKSNSIYLITRKSINIDIESFFKLEKILNSSMFTIETRKNKYKCNILGVFYSSVLREILAKDRKTDHYFYDFEDENGEFQYICDIFNFNDFYLNNNNAEIIKVIATDLKIEFLIDNVDNFISETKKQIEIIDDYQNMIDAIDEIFDLLYHIKELTVESVAKSIIESNWTKTDKKIYELAAFIIQVINTSIDLHQYLVDLLAKLNENSNFKKLLPFIINRMMYFAFSISNNNALLFVHSLYKNKLIQNDYLIPYLRMYKSNKYFDHSDCNLILLFLPELNKIDGINNADVNDIENNNSITKTLCIDDIDTFQSIVSQKESLMKGKVNRSIYDYFSHDLNQINYLNYAALHGSIKCFKFLLLNDQDIDEYTLKMSIIGGNNEIIRIVYNKIIEIGVDKFYPSILDALCQAISMHKNDLFDWILEQNLSFVHDYSKHNRKLFNLIEDSIENCNIHSLVQLIDNGANIQLFSNNFNNFLSLSIKRGFYSLAIFLINFLFKNGYEKSLNIDNEIAYSGNPYMLELFEKNINIESIFYLSIELSSFDIIKYLNDQKKTSVLNRNTYKIFEKCSKNCSKEFWYYLLDQTDPIHFTEKFLLSILKITENGHNTFASRLLIEYYINKKYITNYVNLALFLSERGTIDADIFIIVMNNIDKDLKKILINRAFNNAIKMNNQSLVELLLKEDVDLEKSLICAVSSGNLNIIDLILKKNSKPSFVNKIFIDGTALTIAVQYNKPSIVKKLLSIPGIDPSICQEYPFTPLVLSFNNQFMDIFDILMDFYGDDIKNQKWQFNEVIKSFFMKIGDNKLVDLIRKTKFFDVIKLFIQNDEFNVNYKINKFGDTPLILLAKKSNLVEITKILIENPKTNINLQNYNGKTALFYANSTIAEYIIENEKFNPDENDINTIFYNYCDKIMSSNDDINIIKKLLTFQSLDVNFIPLNNNEIFYNRNDEDEKMIKTPLINSIIRDNTEVFDLIIQHSSFDINKSRIFDALNISLYERKFIMFQKVLDLLDKPKIDIISSLLIKAIKAKCNKQTITFILNHKDFDSKKSDIAQAFLISLPNYSLADILYEYDIEHDHLINQKVKNDLSFSAITTLISQFHKSERSMITNYLIKAGFDPNKPNEELVYPLEYAIENYLDNLSICLIRSNKIDFNKKIESKNKESKYTTYLHLAAQFGRSQIISEILSSKSLNINITNDLGETPLMEACRYDQTDCVNILFENSNLDFLHKNNKGEDAIDIIVNKMKSLKSDFVYKKEEITSKSDYLKEVLKLLRILFYAKTFDAKTAFNIKTDKKKIESIKIHNNPVFKFNFNKSQNSSNENTSKKQENKSNSISLKKLKSKEFNFDKSPIFENYSDVSSPKTATKLSIDQYIQQSNEMINNSIKSNKFKFNFEKNVENQSNEKSSGQKSLEQRNKLINEKIKNSLKTPKFNFGKHAEDQPDENKQKIKNNSSSPSPSFKFDIYNESFSEKPDQNLQILLDKLKKQTSRKNIRKDVDYLKIQKRNQRRPVDSLFDLNEENNQIYNYQQQQNQLMILQQQQQQWLQMIQMNDQYQAQMNMQMMYQNQKVSKKKKKII